MYWSDVVKLYTEQKHEKKEVSAFQQHHQRGKAKRGIRPQAAQALGLLSPRLTVSHSVRGGSSVTTVEAWSVSCWGSGIMSNCVSPGSWDGDDGRFVCLVFWIVRKYMRRVFCVGIRPPVAALAARSSSNL